MSVDDAAAPRPAPVRYSVWVTRAICRRVAAGETLVAICRDADMPARCTVGEWLRKTPKFAEMYARAKVFGDRTGRGRPSSYCPATAHEIVVRVSEGEPLSDIVEDPAMPSMRVVLYWQTTQAEFAEAIELARWAQAERLADLGWKMALEATPQTAHLTRVRLGHLRWSAGIKAPRTHGRMKPVEPPAAPEGPRVLLFRHFHLEQNFATGQHRVVGYRADPETMRPVRDHVGPWTDPVDPVKKAAASQQALLERLARKRAAEEGFDPAELGVGPEEEDASQWL